MQANYPRCLANTLREEGGWTNDPRDPGGPTMRGIIQREYTRYRARKGLPDRSVRFISEAELQDIYAGNYWRPMRGDLWPKGPDQIVFDIAVNSGTGRAPAIMVAALGANTRDPVALAALAAHSADKVGIVKRACARRASFYRSLRTFSAFGRGWLTRNARMEAIGVKMCLEADGVIHVAGELKRERSGARAKAKRAGQGASGAAAGGGASGAGAATADIASWDWGMWLGVALGALALAAVIVALWWAWRKHGERAKAYAAALGAHLETGLADVLAHVKGDRAAGAVAQIAEQEGVRA
jgi:lysozyme family protein